MKRHERETRDIRTGGGGGEDLDGGAAGLIDAAIAGHYHHLVSPAVHKVSHHYVVLVCLPAGPLPLVDGYTTVQSTCQSLV